MHFEVLMASYFSINIYVASELGSYEAGDSSCSLSTTETKSTRGMYNLLL